MRLRRLAAGGDVTGIKGFPGSNLGQNLEFTEVFHGFS
jgi:hypothetical protein